MRLTDFGAYLVFFFLFLGIGLTMLVNIRRWAAQADKREKQLRRGDGK